MTSIPPLPPEAPAADATFVPPPAPVVAAPFEQLGLAAPVLANLARLGYHQMTPIQAASLPVALAGNDLIAQAKTGSGKTAAFGLPLLQRLDPRNFAVQAMVLCPTRELAEQVSQEIRRLARFEENIKVLTLCGGSPIRPQADSLAHGAHVVVGTPGRLMDHLSRGSLQLDALATLVLDEADRMLDMGFFDDIAYVAKACPKARQTLLFSATYPEGVVRLARQFMRQPQEIALAGQHEADKIRQRFYEVAHDQRLHAVGLLLRHYRPVSTLAFCNTKQQCRDLIDVLHAEGFHVLALHGELDQRDRDQVMVQFANRSCSVLVATDVAARAPRHRQARGGDQRGRDPRPRGACPPHRPHRPRRRERLGAQPGRPLREKPRRRHRPRQRLRAPVGIPRRAPRRRPAGAPAADGHATDPRRAQRKDPPR